MCGAVLHAAEGGLTLARTVDFEVPYLRKQAAKNQQLMSDLDRRVADSLKSASGAASDFKQECQAMGIAESATGSAPLLHRALLDLTHELPTLLERAVKATREPHVEEAIQYYHTFTAQVNSSSGCSAGEGEGDESASAHAHAQSRLLLLLPTLQEVREGRTEAADGPLLPLEAEEDSAGNGSAIESHVQWALGATGEGGDGDGGGVSWDVSGSLIDNSISWEVEVEVEADAETESPEIEPSTLPPEVSWDIDISGAGETAVQDGIADETTSKIDGDAGATAAAFRSGNNNSGSTSSEVHRLVSDASYRARLLDDVFELRAFLMQRISEMATGGQAQQMVSSMGADVAAVDAAALQRMHDSVDAVISNLTENRVAQLLSLATSAAYRKRLMATFARHAGQEEKFKRAAVDAEARKADAQHQLVLDSAKLAAYLRRARIVKAGVEAALGSRLGRRVNVQGEINAVLSQN